MFPIEPNALSISDSVRRAVGFVLAGAMSFTLAVLLTPVPSHAADSAAPKAEKPAAPAAAGAKKPASPEELPPPEWPAGPGNQLSQDEKNIDETAYPRFKASLDELNHYASKAFNGPMFESSEKLARGVVRVKPSAAWMGSGRNQEKSAMTIYRFWRNANRLLPVRVIITDDKGEDYILIQDTPHGLDYLVRDREAKP